MGHFWAEKARHKWTERFLIPGRIYDGLVEAVSVDAPYQARLIGARLARELKSELAFLLACALSDRHEPRYLHIAKTLIDA